ncbi:MAG: Na+/H+ antiporter subunit E [Gammaproteobacteria bacterium]|nr:Na+/H+ antiporter subunit E [Gammaproteobacteria bacterium]NNJ90685.1 Na+/H+ antiporter subunit E [Gammaproteobacteria bacterium]
MLLWFLLTGTLHSDELVAGALVSSIVAFLTLERTSIFSAINISFQTPFALLLYLFEFYKTLVIANFDMARRVITPSLPINPNIITVKTTLKSDLGKMLLANSITLTPGTLSVDVDGDDILVHWVDCPPDCDTQMATQLIAASFEKHIRGFLN